jgi:hypothetical protein
MRTITKKLKVYKFDELSDKAKQKVLDDNRYINLDDGWYEGIVDSHIEDWEKKYGIKATASPICFSIDRSKYLYFPQENIWIEDVNIFCEAMKGILPTEVITAIKKKDVILSLSVKYYGGGDGTQIAKYEVYNKLDLPEVSPEITKWLNETLLEPLWKEIDESYYMEMSDEAVKETICMNEYEYDKDGDMI